MKKLVCGALLALAFTGAAQAGGWATVGIEPLPDGTKAGQDWTVQVTVRQHGVTPLSGVRPVVGITGPGGERHEFVATPAAGPGVYRADVVFPSAGSWSVDVFDGFTQYGGAKTHTFGAFEIGSGGAGGFPTWPVVAGALVAVAAAGALLVAWRRRLGSSRPAAAASR